VLTQPISRPCAHLAAHGGPAGSLGPRCRRAQRDRLDLHHHGALQRQQQLGERWVGGSSSCLASSKSWSHEHLQAISQLTQCHCWGWQLCNCVSNRDPIIGATYEY
jgi:hypothetical protein